MNKVGFILKRSEHVTSHDMKYMYCMIMSKGVLRGFALDIATYYFKFKYRFFYLLSLILLRIES